MKFPEMTFSCTAVKNGKKCAAQFVGAGGYAPPLYRWNGMTLQGLRDTATCADCAGRRFGRHKDGRPVAMRLDHAITLALSRAKRKGETMTKALAEEIVHSIRMNSTKKMIREMAQTSLGSHEALNTVVLVQGSIKRTLEPVVVRA